MVREFSRPFSTVFTLRYESIYFFEESRESIYGLFYTLQLPLLVFLALPNTLSEKLQIGESTFFMTDVKLKKWLLRLSLDESICKGSLPNMASV
jgi:hypothetical protein